MDGSTLLCSSNNVTYSTPDYVNCTYSWTYDTNKLDYVSGQGTNNFQLTPKSPLVSGSAWVKLSLTIGSPVNKTRDITTNVWIGIPNVDDVVLTNAFGEHNNLCTSDTDNYFAASSNSGSQNFEWKFTDLNNNIIYNQQGYYQGGQVEIYATNPGWYLLHLRVINDCGIGDWTSFEVEFADCSMDYLSFSPNPASTETIIELQQNGSKEKVPTMEWNLEVYDQMQVLKIKSHTIKDKTYHLNTSDWKEGIYIVRAIIGDKVITQRLVIKH